MCFRLILWEATIISRLFRHDVSFDDVTMGAMSEAFDQVCDALGNFGTVVMVLEIIARRIVGTATTGDRNPIYLHRQALNAMGIDERSVNQLAA